MSQRIRVLGVIAVAALPLIVLAALSLWQEAAQRQGGIADDRLTLARAAALTANTFVDGNLTALQNLGLTPAVSDPARHAELSAVLDRIRNADPNSGGIALYDASGWNIAATRGAAPRTINVAERAYFQQVLASGHSAVSSVVPGRLTGTPTVVLAVPVDLADGQRGVLVGSLALARIGEELRAVARGEGLQVVAFDAEGQTFVHPDPEQVRAGTSVRGRPEAEAALSGEQGSRIVAGADGTELLVAYAPVPGFGWGVVISQPTAVAFGAVRRDLFEGLGLLGLVAAVAVGLGWYFGGRLSLYYEGLVEARARAAETEHFLAEASRVLGSSLDNTTIVRSMVGLALPRLADWCSVHVREGDEIRRIELSHANPARAELFDTLRRHPPAGSSPGSLVARVLQSGRSQILAEVADDYIHAIAQSPGHAALLRSIGMKSAMAVPLQVGGQVVGAMLFVSGESNRRYGPEHLAEAEDLASRCALALDNARLYREARDAVGVRDEFLSVASHELRTPLATLQAHAQLVLRRLAREGSLDPPQTERSLRSILEQADRLGRLITQLLDVSRLEAGKLVLERRETDLTAIIEGAVAAAQAQTDRHAIRLETPPGLTASIDSLRLEQVLANLLTNAIKFSPDGGPIDVTVGVSSRGLGVGENPTPPTPNSQPPAPSLEISVRDRGIGIPPEKRPAIFDRFYQAHADNHSSGMGLGLYISRQIVELHGGELAAEFPDDGGTRFVVRLPANAASRPDAASLVA